MKAYEASWKIEDKLASLEREIELNPYLDVAQRKRGRDFAKELKALNDVISMWSDDTEEMKVIFVTPKSLEERIKAADDYDIDNIGKWVTLVRTYTCLKDEVVWLICVSTIRDVLRKEQQ